MILNTTDTIRFRFTNGAWRLQNKQYKMFIKNSDGWKEIYNGLTFFNNQGISDIYIDPILRDLVFRWETEYYDDQIFRPINFITDVQNQVIDPIEKHNSFMTTYVKLQIENIEQIKEVTGSYSHFYESTNFELINPYDTNRIGKFQNLSIYNKVLPHIPNVSSDKFWLGLNFSINHNYNETNPLYLKIPQGFIQIRRNGYGNYACAYSLKELAENLHYDPYQDNVIIMSSVYNRLTPDDVAVAIVDHCPADYYVCFSTNYAWNCVPMKGNVVEDITQDNVVIENTFGHQETLWNKTKSHFKLNSGIVTKDEYNTLLSLYSAYKIYVYDVQKDKGTWCTVANNRGNGLPNLSHKIKNFSIELIENKYQIA